MAILLKSAREAASPEDGARVLVERRRPSGVARDSLLLRNWYPALGPGDDLRRWFAQRPTQWPIFRHRYLLELLDQKATDALGELHSLVEDEGTVTLLATTKNPERSHAAILRDLLEGVRKPPATSGPDRAVRGVRIRAQRAR